MEGICHIPLLGQLKVRVGATDLLHPKYHQCPLQHSCWAQDIRLGCGHNALVGGGVLICLRERMLPAVRGEAGQSGEKNPFTGMLWLLPSSSNVLQRALKQSEHNHSSLGIWGMTAYSRLPVFNTDVALLVDTDTAAQQIQHFIPFFVGGEQAIFRN